MTDGLRIRLRDVTLADADLLDAWSSLEKAGFRREGVARGSQFRAGSFHDLVTYARLRDDA
jgi:RimJ/RimL family protein N-acetyltransferase